MYVLGKIYTEREGLERCLKSWILGNTEGDDNKNLRGRVWICIHPSLCTSSNWNSSPSWETNASFLNCPRLQQDTLASSPINVAYQYIVQEMWGQATH